MITRLVAERFKSLARLELELGAITVLVGANGVGKSSVLEALVGPTRLLERAASRQLGAVGTRDVTFGSDVMPTLRLEARTGTLDVSFGELPPSLDQVRFELTTGGSSRRATFGELVASTPLREAFEHETTQVSLVRLVPRLLASASFGEDSRGVGAGAGLAAVLAELIGLRDARLERIEEDLRAIVPWARRVRTQTTRRRVVDQDEAGDVVEVDQVGHKLELEDANGHWIPARNVSAGTLIALGLLTTAHVTGARTLLVDDLDHGLHPSAQRALAVLLKKLSESRQLQLVCTTHSPYLLDEVDPADVRVLKRDASGHTHARLLSEHREWSKWGARLAAGELWSSFGEDWVFEEGEHG